MRFRVLILAVSLLGCTSAGGPAPGSSPPTTGTPEPNTTPPPPVADECLTEVTPGSHLFTCSELTFNVHVPASCTATYCGLIFDVHGFTMSGAMQDNNTELSKRALAYDFIVVQPNATPDPPAASWTPATDDDKVYDFLQRTMRAWHVDIRKVHFTGFSQGGFMTWRMLCDHPDLFASVAPAAYADGCAEPPAEVDVLYMHGTTDALVPFSGALGVRDALVDRWSLDGEQSVSTDSEHTWTRYTNGSGTTFEFIAHDYSGATVLGGHCYPGSVDVDGGEPGQLVGFACHQQAAFHWGEAVLDFFVSHPK